MQLPQSFEALVTLPEMTVEPLPELEFVLQVSLFRSAQPVSFHAHLQPLAGQLIQAQRRCHR